MNLQDIRRRVKQLEAEVDNSQRALQAGQIDTKAYNAHLDAALEEVMALRKTQKNLEHYAGGMARAEDIMSGQAPAPTLGDAFGSGPVLSEPPSLNFTEPQLKALHQAAIMGQPLTMEIQSKGVLRPGFRSGDVMTKSPTLESGLTGGLGQLPPIIAPGLFMSLPYEPSRVSKFLPSSAISEGPSIAWLTHTSNANPAAAVAEGATKPDIGASFIETVVKPTKIAALASTSMEMVSDYGTGQFGQWLSTELQRELVNQESNYLLNAGVEGGPSGATFSGLLATSGTLTYSVAADEFPLDALSRAFVALRTGPAFAEADLCIMNPTTVGALRRIRDGNGRYVLDLLAGARNLTADGSPPALTPAAANPGGFIPQGTGTQVQDLWGVPIVETTQVPAGTAVALSVRAGAAFVYFKWGLMIQFNMYSDTAWENNLLQWRAEERCALATPRPEAIQIITNLPTS
jgi:hypothetical protein